MDFVGAQNSEKDMFEAFQEKKQRKQKIVKRIVFCLILGLMIVAAWTLFSRSRKSAESENSPVENTAEVAKIQIPENQDHVFVNDVAGVIEEKSTEAATEDAGQGLAGKSENYELKDLAIGGISMALMGGDENLPVAVSDVRSETLMSKDGKSIKMLVLWKTNKLAKSEVLYSKNGGMEEKSFKEDAYGFSHALVINQLDESTRYLFTVKVKDRGGNEINSDQLAVFTGAKPVSVFEMIATQFGDIFGWAMKK